MGGTRNIHCDLSEKLENGYSKPTWSQICACIYKASQSRSADLGSVPVRTVIVNKKGISS